MRRTARRHEPARGNPLLIYGATGVTGRGVTQLAVAAGLRPILAGRDRAGLQALAAAHQLEVRVADLSPASLDGIFRGVKVIVSCIGPYTQFGAPLVEGAIRNGANLLDFSGAPPTAVRRAARRMCR